MLDSLLGYQRGADIDARWLVIEGSEDFFEVTKRIHNLLHSDPGDREGLGQEDREIYERALRQEISEITRVVQSNDVVVLHDPQTVGLTPALRELGATLIWSCHVGIDQPNDQARAAWDFLRPSVRMTDIQIFSRSSYAWEGLDRDRLAIVAPCIDAFSPKNQELAEGTVEAILGASGVMTDGSRDGEPEFERADGTSGRVTRPVEMIEDRPLPPDAPLVLQVSRWDRLKDHVGVLHGFDRHVPGDLGGHLILAGPAVGAVSDDPEEAGVLNEVREARAELTPRVRSRVHVACVPMEDPEENAAIVNALQRRADIIVQKSLAEGFGLTVAEGMWKGRPTVASRVGGIQDQIVHGKSGLLVDDPEDLRSFGATLSTVLQNPQDAQRLGAAAHERVRDEFLAPRLLTQLTGLLERVVA
jgi:trehalose synthase